MTFDEQMNGRRIDVES